MDWQGLNPALDDNLYYVLYDLRKDPSLSKIHLPTPTEEGPVMLLIDQKDYPDIYSELLEMNENEGFQWMTCLLQKPLTSTNSSDLKMDTPYILIAHMDFIRGDLEGFYNKLTSMKRWVTN